MGGCCSSSQEFEGNTGTRNIEKQPIMDPAKNPLSVDMIADEVVEIDDPAKDPKAIKEAFANNVFTELPTLDYMAICLTIQNNPEMALYQRKCTQHFKQLGGHKDDTLPIMGDQLIHVATRKKSKKILYFLLTIGINPDSVNSETKETCVDIIMNKLKHPPADIDSRKLLALLLDFHGTFPNRCLEKVLERSFKELNSMVEHDNVRKSEQNSFSNMSPSEVKELKQTTLCEKLFGAREVPVPRTAYGALVDFFDTNELSPTYQEWRPVYLYIGQCVIFWSDVDHNGETDFRFRIDDEEFWPINRGGFIHLITLAKPSLRQSEDSTLPGPAWEFVAEIHKTHRPYIFRAGSRQMIKNILSAVRQHRSYLHGLI